MKLLFILFCLFALLSIGKALIHCEPNGQCTGDGSPDSVTACSGCYSCTYKNCCHKSFTNAYTHCPIPGWRAPAIIYIILFIHCEYSGICTGSGTPDSVTTCKGCYSCTYKNCCHKSFTNPYTHCSIPGYRAAGYKGGK
ncbi:hypothetical protein Mgra_00003062 [Meloidogyne graminicola]|uniref:Uncharacterized protein n=1 Tax=Meloidogyne graminicola TaxID=189291 RepID=A0A8S9ZVD8_9BILA|nr:hypothetical protein Mgra_00003062 [Meloidogyne graminicola]